MQTTQNKIAGFFGLAITAVGFLVLLGWQFDIEFLKRPFYGVVAMNPITAIEFIFFGLSVFLLSLIKNQAFNPIHEKRIIKLIILLAVLAISTGVLKLSDYFFYLNINIDEWLFNTAILNDQLLFLSSNISPASALSFILLGICILLSVYTKSKLNFIANYLVLLVLCIGLFASFAFIYSVPELTGVYASHPIALNTAVCFALASLSVLLLNSNKGFMKIFTDSNSGGFVSRLFIPSTIIFAFLIGLFILLLKRHFSISPEMIVTLGVSSVVISGFFITLYISIQLNKISVNRDEAQKELVKANKELSLSHERFFTFFESSPVATNIIRVKDGHYIHANNAFLKLFSLTREQVIGKTSAEFNIIDTKKRGAVLEYVKEKNYNMQDVEAKLISSTGKKIDILASTQLIELDGEPHMLTTLIDITERKGIEKEIRKSRKSLNDAQKLSKTGSWEFNLKTGELFWSDELYHIFEVEETPAEKLFEVCRKKIHPDDIANLDDAINLANEAGLAAVYEHRVIMGDGSIKHLLGLGEIIKDEEGKPLWLRGTTQDITERKEFEEKLRQNNIQLDLKNKELEQFAFVASHDLQEPLRTISSFTELLTDEYAAKFDNNANTYVRFISQSAMRMRDLITGLLEYSRLGNKLVLEPTDCNTVLNNALENLHVAIKESGAVIKAENLPVLKAYPIELELLFQNLIGNAIKFRKKEVIPEINIKAKKREHDWEFSFADNGIGIDQKHFEKIFLLFQRLHSRDNYKGSGIGLSHCKKIVELHKGRIWVESKPGEGSVFSFTIPEVQN